MLASLTGLIAVSAYAGAVALATGMTGLGTVVEERLPFGSPVFAGVALALIVAVPMTVATRQAAIGGPRTTNAAITAGVLLVGWIVIELAVIRTFSWLQPTLAAAGAGVLLPGCGRACAGQSAREAIPVPQCLDPENVHGALELAVRAPSVHNSQPWRFVVGSQSIALHADPTRQLTATDPDGRDLLISCGAALHHLRVALAAFGWLTVTHRMPDPARPEHLATLELLPRQPTHADLTLAVSIPRRQTDRRGYLPRALSDDCLDELARYAAAQGVGLCVVRGAARAYLVSAIAEADQLQRANPAYVYELARWTGRRTGAPDGVPTASGPPSAAYGDLPVPQFSVTKLHTTDAESEEDGAGTLLVLGTTDDDPTAQLRTGEATSAILLAATCRRMATCPLTQPLEIPSTRERVRSHVLNNVMVPQLVLRIGWPQKHRNPLPPSQRRPISELAEGLRTDCRSGC